MRGPEIVVVSPAGPEGSAVLRAYFSDVVSRAYRRTATEAEVDAAMRAEPSDDLTPPTGLLLVAREDGVVLGCAGLRLLPDRTGEVTRLFVAPRARGAGLGRRLLAAVEAAAREHRLAALRLDTRSDLVEARRLYASAGYREVPPFNDGPHAEHWFTKDLA